ncbi:MAG: hypothetical protein R2847_08915 [Bacteroidia bacterium]
MNLTVIGGTGPYSAVEHNGATTQNLRVMLHKALIQLLLLMQKVVPVLRILSALHNL